MKIEGGLQADNPIIDLTKFTLVLALICTKEPYTGKTLIIRGNVAILDHSEFDILQAVKMHSTVQSNAYVVQTMRRAPHHSQVRSIHSLC